ncbi:Flp family type IVb pilin [Amorphus coralli]|uniref:Flp family type IVb pilin n=1 Tax=Amorphus coralli TaxID=340680 RepID=UPI00036F7F3F|nr:Flp family type IVb pilin [Amorphus coralli]
MNKLFARFASDKKGGGLVEYSLIVALIALGSVTAMTTLGDSIETGFGKIGTSLDTAVNENEYAGGN